MDTNGTYFNPANVNQIKKGVTTADQVVSLFGEPNEKEILSPDQIMWHYNYQSVTNSVTRDGWYPVISQEMGNKTEGFDQKLDILLQNDIVINFSSVKAPIEIERQ